MLRFYCASDLGYGGLCGGEIVDSEGVSELRTVTMQFQTPFNFGEGIKQQYDCGRFFLLALAHFVKSAEKRSNMCK